MINVRVRRHDSRERGIGKLTLLVFGALAVITTYCAYHIIPFYYYYYELLNQFDAHIRQASVFSDQEIRQKLMYHIKKMQINVDPEDLIIERSEGRMRILLRYNEVFYVAWKEKDYDIHTFEFLADVERAY